MSSQNIELGLKEKQAFVRSMQIQMLEIVLDGVDNIGVRSLRALQSHKLIKKNLNPKENVDLDVLKDLQHPRRVALPDGPLVIYLTEKSEPQKSILDLSMLLFSESQETRTIVFNYFEKKSLENRSFCTPKTAFIMNSHKGTLLSEMEGEWEASSVAIHDALNEDILLALHGVQQCLVGMPGIEDELGLFVNRLLYPTIASLDSIRLPVDNPERTQGALIQLLDELIENSNSLGGLCRSYIQKMGFLPFSKEYGLSIAVKRWIGSNSDRKLDVWKDIWDWVSIEKSPLSSYHACSVFVLFPEFIPSGELPFLWRKILSVIRYPLKDDDCELEPLWAIRRDLVRHYTYHLESRLPGMDGAAIACFVWWFVEQVAQVLFPDPESAEFYKEHWIEPALELSNRVWLDAGAPIQSSCLRYVTHLLDSPWAMSLLILLGEHIDELLILEQRDEVCSKFNEALIMNILRSKPFPLEKSGGAVIALEYSLEKSLKKWAGCQKGEAKKFFDELLFRRQRLGTNQGLSEALLGLGELNFIDQLMVCFDIKTAVLTDISIAQKVADVFADTRWRLEVLHCIETRVQDAIIDALWFFVIESGGEWAINGPRYCAELCEKEEDETRRKQLFSLVVHMSLSANSVSAVNRLLKGTQKAKFLSYVEEYRTEQSRFSVHYPAWVSGKWRSLLSNMYVR